LPSAAATNPSDASGPAFAERERLLHPGVLLYSGTCSGLAAALGGLFALFVAGLILYPPAGALSGDWLLLRFLFPVAAMLPFAAVAAVIVTCALLIPIHWLLVRLRLRNHIFYLVAMLAIIFASHYVVMAGRDWSFAFTIPFAAIAGALVFRHLAYTVRPVPHGRPEALMVLLWACVISAYLGMFIVIGSPAPARNEVYRLWVLYGIPAMALLAMAALFARAWSRRVMAALSCIGLALPLGFAAAFLVALLPLRQAGSDCSVGTHRLLDLGSGSVGLVAEPHRACVRDARFRVRTDVRGNRLA
jgi:hypothetical protein